MVEYAQPPRSFRVLLTLASIVVLIAGMRAAQELILPFLISVFVALVSVPIVFWMERKGLPPVLAVIVVATLLIGAGVAIGAIVGESCRVRAILRDGVRRLTTIISPRRR